MKTLNTIKILKTARLAATAASSLATMLPTQASAHSFPGGGHLGGFRPGGYHPGLPGGGRFLGTGSYYNHGRPSWGGHGWYGRNYGYRFGYGYGYRYPVSYGPACTFVNSWGHCRPVYNIRPF